MGALIYTEVIVRSPATATLSDSAPGTIIPVLQRLTSAPY